MSQEPVEQKRRLEEKLNKALDEARSKLNVAYNQTAKGTNDSAMSVWLAAEALEYASSMFNLAYGLDDLDPQVKVKKREDSIVLIQNSMDSLKRVGELRRNSVTEAYACLRTAADSMKTVYLNTIRESAKSQASL